MRKLALTASVLLFVLAGSTAQAENYGGMSIKYQQQIERGVHAWFDQVGAASRFICVIRHESGYNPTAFNDDDFPVVRYGLFQITWPTWAR